MCSVHIIQCNTQNSGQQLQCWGKLLYCKKLLLVLCFIMTSVADSWAQVEDSCSWADLEDSWNYTEDGQADSFLIQLQLLAVLC